MMLQKLCNGNILLNDVQSKNYSSTAFK